MFKLEESDHQMVVSLIAAVAKNGVIGNGPLIPWKSQEDMKYFKNLTMGSPIIMGRTTWDSLKKKPLPGRLNIVLTKNEDLIGLIGQSEEGEGPIFMHDLTPALTMLSENKIEECFIIGGAKVYDTALSLDLVDQMFINHMKFDATGDVFFPFIEPSMWDVEESVQKYNDFVAKLYIRKRELEREADEQMQFIDLDPD